MLAAAGALCACQKGVFMTIPFKLDYVIEKTLAKQAENRHGRALRALTGMKVSDAEARALWPRILEHKWYTSERLGRNIGLRVAAIDYFENIHSPRAQSRPAHRLPRRRGNNEQQAAIWNSLEHRILSLPFRR